MHNTEQSVVLLNMTRFVNFTHAKCIGDLESETSTLTFYILTMMAVMFLLLT